MNLIILRHGSREIGHHDKLNSIGEAQAHHLGQLVESQVLPTPDIIWTSPKHRTNQTMTPVSNGSNIPIKVDPRLDERAHGESDAQWRSRILETIDSIDKIDFGRTLYTCSHFDWLDDFVALLPTDAPDAPPFCAGEYRRFERAEGLFLLKGVGQLDQC